MPGHLSIYLYDEGASSSLDIRVLAGYINKRTGIDVEIGGNLISKSSSEMKSLAEEFALAKVVDLDRGEENYKPLPAEIEYEVSLLKTNKPSGLLYDGFCLQRIFSRLIQTGKHTLSHLHIIFTSRLFGTFADNRYHARAALFGFPTIISTTGIVEAPAKPREFYLKSQLGQDLLTLKEEFKGRFIDYDDPRLTEVMKGYCMQALFYLLSRNPFCKDKGCRLYNAHWQEELIRAQLGSKYEFCRYHEEEIHRVWCN